MGALCDYNEINLVQIVSGDFEWVSNIGKKKKGQNIYLLFGFLVLFFLNGDHPLEKYGWFRPGGLGSAPKQTAWM